jgi:multicomponent Na+:H+ antiporter subunit E
MAVYLAFFLYEMVKANFQVVKAVLSPRFTFRSAAIRYKSKIKTIPELVTLTNSITLTPGTLVVDANPHNGEILIHVMSAESSEQIKDELHRSLEKKLLWAMRGENT